MTVAVTRLGPEFYTLDVDKEEKKPTQFLLQPLSQLDNLRIGGLVEIDGDKISVDADAIEIALLGGLCGWKDFYDKDGKEIGFSSINQAGNVNRIPSIHMLTLATEIVIRSNATEDDEKK